MGVVSGGALWRCLCQSIRSFEGRRIFEMGIRVRRRAEKSSSSSSTAAAAAMAGVERKERASGRVESREGERGVEWRLQRGSIQRWTKVHSHLPPRSGGEGEDAGRGLMQKGATPGWPRWRNGGERQGSRGKVSESESRARVSRIAVSSQRGQTLKGSLARRK